VEPAVTFLIDGYNLMHAVGLASARLPPGRLEAARLRLLDWLADAADGRGALLRVVFDAKAAPAASPEADHRGVRVAFAFRRTADERIEELVGAEPRPDRVTVVSNDGQVREAARRRGCGLFACEEFVDWLVGGRPGARPLPVPEPDKPEPPATPDELAAWLAAFSAPRRKRT
jgi:predicted RNA-binding protein with PIN domain